MERAAKEEGTDMANDSDDWRLDGKRILVVGGCGFIGGHLVRSLAPCNHVTALDWVPPNEPVEGVRYIEHDLRRPLNYDELPAQVDVLFYLSSAFFLDIHPPLENIAITAVGVIDTLEYAVQAGATSFVFTSTGSVYPLAGQPLKEGLPLEPKDSFYSAAKYSAELFVGLYSDRLNGVVVRLFGVYGKGTSNPFGGMAKAVRDGTPLRLHRDGTPRINPIYVKDLLPYLESAATLGRHETINMGGERVVDNVEMANLMGEMLGREPVIEWLEGGSLDVVGDVSSMLQLSDYRPRWSLEQGLRAWLLHDDLPDAPVD